MMLTMQLWLSSLEHYVFAPIGKMSISEVTSARSCYRCC